MSLTSSPDRSKWVPVVRRATSLVGKRASEQYGHRQAEGSEGQPTRAVLRTLIIKGDERRAAVPSIIPTIWLHREAISSLLNGGLRTTTLLGVWDWRLYVVMERVQVERVNGEGVRMGLVAVISI